MLVIIANMEDPDQFTSSFIWACAICLGLFLSGWELSGSVGRRLDWRSKCCWFEPHSLQGQTMCCVLDQDFFPCLVISNFVQPKKTCLDTTELLLAGLQRIKPNKPCVKKCFQVLEIAKHTLEEIKIKNNKK